MTEAYPLSWGTWNTLPKKAGIYAIKRISCSQEYIGSAISLYGRARHHRNDLLSGNHHNQKLQRAFLKYGPQEFCLFILEFVEQSARLTEREQFHIDTRNPFFNDAKIAGSILGVKRSRETIEKLRQKAHERNSNPEYLRKLSDASLGRPKSESHRRNLSLAITGKRHTDEARAKIAAAGLGRKQKPESIEKTRLAHLGAKRTPETCLRISLAKRGIMKGDQMILL